MPFPHASQALSRFTVLDLTRVRSGPTCVRQLADWGANVIKIDALTEDTGGEQPGGPRHGSDFQNLHRNKRAMTLNLKDPRGLEVFKRLAAKADVVVENFRPDVKTTLEALPTAHAVVLAVAHKEFVGQGWSLIQRLSDSGKVVIDVKSALDRSTKPADVTLWRL